MGTYLKDNKTGNTLHVIEIINDDWDLNSQLNALEQWFNDNPNFHFIDGEWIADVGFDPKPETSVAGYTISVKLMQQLAKNNVSLWLSDYRGV